MSLLRTSRHAMSSSSIAKEKVKTGILMLNMGMQFNAHFILHVFLQYTTYLLYHSKYEKSYI